MSNKQKITKQVVDKMRAGDCITDSDVAGFRARCHSSGKVSYEYRYRAADGRRRFLPLGLHGELTPDEARTLAKKRAGAVADGKDPVLEQKTTRALAAKTVDAVLDLHVAMNVEGKLRTVYDVRRAFDVYVRPVIGKTPIYSLTREDIVDLLDRIEKNNGGPMADHVLAYVRRAFNWYMTRDTRFTSPIIKGMARTKPGERKRRRILTPEEICDVWRATETPIAGQPFFLPAWVRLLLLTAQRAGEVCKMHRDGIARDKWIIDGSQFKNGLPQLVPLTAAALALIPKTNSPTFVFSSDGGETFFKGRSKAKTALDAKINALRKGEGRKPMPHWVFHDLRRTGRSLLSALTTPDIAERVLGHVIGGVRGTYDVYEYADEKRDALEKLARRIASIVGPRGKGEVVRFPKKPAAASQRLRKAS